MRKLINQPEDFVDEFLEGILLAHPAELRAASADHRAVVRADAGTQGRVGIVTGGGSGHLPLFLGFVGQGLASGVAVGNVFSSPSPDQVLAATLASDGGAGVLYLYGNYGGDVYNFDLAAEMAEAQGIRTRTVLGADDVLSAPAEERSRRRGVAGIALVFKCAGAAAERGDSLEEVERLARKAADAVVTMGVGLSPTILPVAAKPTFELPEGEMEVGVGIHGEPGRRRGPIETADEVADEFCDVLLGELGLASGDRVVVLVNGLGSTPLEELYLLYRRVHHRLAGLGVGVHEPFVGEYATSLEMTGASVSIMKVDDELAALIDAPAASPFFRHGTSSGPSTEREPLKVRPGGGLPPQAGREIARGGNGGWREHALRIAEELPAHADELRDLDAAVGDGDLGITVSAGARAVAERLRDLPTDAARGEVLFAAGSAFASANPSTYAALVGSGLMAAGGALNEGRIADLAGVLGAVRERIQAKGGAERGDKTVVDAIWAAEDALRAAPDDWTGALSRVRELVEKQTSQPNRRGRAAWLQERSQGHADPGSVAFLRLLECALA